MSEETQKPNPFLNNNLFAATANVKRPFKMSFEGFAGDGKSYTMGLVVLGVWIAEGRKEKRRHDGHREIVQAVRRSLSPKGGTHRGVASGLSRRPVHWRDFTKILKDVRRG